MQSVTTYIHFDGNCREAMQFYQNCLETDIQLTPLPDNSGKPSSDPAAKIMHSQLLRNGQPILMASDGSSGGAVKAGNNFSVSVDCESIAEIDRLFAAIDENGHVILPLGNVPWGARFGMLTDQFGIQWLFNCAASQ
jgi:PhnB protein